MVMEELSSDQVDLLDRIRDEWEAGGGLNLSDWQNGFIEDILDRYDTYHERTFLSENQWGKIHQIAEEMEVE
jgi:hypothetical protein